MTSNKTFPNTEPPPYTADSSSSQENVSQSQNAGQEPQLDSKLTEAMMPGEAANTMAPGVSNPENLQSQAISSVQQQAQQISAQQASTFIPKKGPPKALLIALGVLGLIIIIGLLFMLFGSRNSEPDLVGTKGELTWWGTVNSENVVRPLIERYQSEHPNVKITYIQQAEQDYRERLATSLAQGKGPDIFEIHNSWAPMLRSELSILPESVMDKETYKKSFYPVVAKDFLTSSGVVAIPLEYDALTLFYNQDIFDSAATIVPNTWDGVAETAKKLTQRGSGSVILQSGVALGLLENIDYWQDIIALMVLQNGGVLDKPGPKMEDALQFYINFSQEDKVWNMSLPPSVSAFSKNKLAMLFAPTRAAKDILLENPSIRFKTSIIPQLPKNTASDPDLTYATYWAQSVWVRSGNQEVAWGFLNFLSSGESLQEMNSNRKNIGALEKAYPRPEMAVLQREDKILGSIILDANNATSWYLYDKTHDGSTGINSQINEAFSNVLSKRINGKNVTKDIENLASEIKTIFSKYVQK